MVKKIINNNLYLILIIIIAFVFLSFTTIIGCNIQEEEKNIEGVETNVEINIEETAATEEIDSEVNNISVEEVYEIINNDQGYLILDVRTIDEFNKGHIKGAVLIPISELGSRLNELPKNKPIITYCHSGIRSRNAANILVENGFKYVYDMGGILEWIEKGYPVVIENN